MILTMMANLFAICTLTNFVGYPEVIRGPVVLQSKTYVTLRIRNKTETDFIEVTVKSNNCEFKKQ